MGPGVESIETHVKGAAGGFRFGDERGGDGIWG